MIGRPHAEEIIICSAVSIQSQNVTDGRTDGWRDGRRDGETAPLYQYHTSTLLCYCATTKINYPFSYTNLLNSHANCITPLALS